MLYQIRRPAGLMTAGSTTFDASTLLWVAAVITNGGTVSATEKGYVDMLIKGAKSDGFFNKLDALWLYALDSSSINQPSALTDIINLRLATNVNSTTFGAGGFTGNGSSMYIDSNFNPVTATSPNYAQNSACVFAWNNTSGTDTGMLFSVLSGGDTQQRPAYTDGNSYFALNSAQVSVSNPSGATGLYLLNRTDASNVQEDFNGSQIANPAAASNALTSTDIVALQGNGANFSTRQISCLGIGGGLSGTDRTNIYSRLRTYMTSVGVP